MLIVKVETLHLDHAWHKMILTLFLVSLRLNIKLLYLFLYLLSVSLYKWKSSRSIFFASSEALSTEMFKSESFNLKCRKCTWAIMKCPDLKKKKVTCTQLSKVLKNWPLYEDFFQRITHTSPDCLQRHGFLWRQGWSLMFWLLFHRDTCEDRVTKSTEWGKICRHTTFIQHRLCLQKLFNPKPNNNKF